jgi:hypothetical protein
MANPNHPFFGGNPMVKHRGIFAAILIAAFVTTGLALHVRADDAAAGVTGTWTWTVQGFNGDTEVTLKLKQDGEKVTGTITNFQGEEQEIQGGMFKDNTLTFKTTNDFNGNTVTNAYTFTVNGDSIKGKSETTFSRDIEGKRSK